MVVVPFPGIDRDGSIGRIVGDFFAIGNLFQIVGLYIGSKNMSQTWASLIGIGLELLVWEVGKDADWEIVDEADHEYREGVGILWNQVQTVLEVCENGPQELSGEVQTQQDLDQNQVMVQDFLGHVEHKS